MISDRLYVNYITNQARKFYIGETAMHVAAVLQENCVSDHTRLLLQQEGYANAYTALAYQHNYTRDDSYEAILSDMKMATKMQFALLPDFVRRMLSREYGDTKVNRADFCKEAYRKALTLICNDTQAANEEAKKRKYYAEIPF